jgi:hypothetical protein
MRGSLSRPEHDKKPAMTDALAMLETTGTVLEASFNAFERA